MTAPVLYADIADLKQVMDSTDGGTGTGAQLSDAQLTLALQAGSTRVSLYAGAIYDSSTPAAEPPSAFHDLTLDIAAWYAWTYYLKSKALTPNHPVMVRYTEAMKVLQDARDGKISLTVGVLGSGAAGAAIINRIPNVFTGFDSNTAILGDQLIVDSPVDEGLDGGTGSGWIGINSGVESP